ncbi:hypothetical protein Taro_045748 [Colocasia esculenta]|uniref:Beta-glucosidase n=1 Tax=Colocasia esculenta TaxID=4460 RepID=A0A843X592_COLES|nr:hypothetical protein [Colocasia esculenta]
MGVHAGLPVGAALLLLLLPLPEAPPCLADPAVQLPNSWRSPSSGDPEYSRDDFPRSFVFGAGTSAYQAEGAVDEDGRSPSIWDTYAHAELKCEMWDHMAGRPATAHVFAGMMLDGSTADVSADVYHKYKEDVNLMSETGLEAYRFSISWSRLIPNGRGAINPKGLMFYNNLINELVKHGIQPHVTLFHLDLPQALEDEYSGWLSPRIVDDFTAYADVCFREFGDRVSHWTTLNEPNIFAIASYDNGLWPPRRCSTPFGLFNCSAGNSTVEPYVVVHHSLLAHAAVVELYRAKYQAVQRGWVGINVYSFAFTPLTDSAADAEAAKRATEFMMGWIMEPLVSGDYPNVMKTIAGSKIPSFTERQKQQLKGAADFFGLNHYASSYIADDPDYPKSGLSDFNGDIHIKYAAAKNATPSAQFLPVDIPVDPPGLQKVLEYLKQEYGNPPIYIHENGYGTPSSITFNDTARIDTIKGYVRAVLAAMRNGSNARGYFIWSFVDVFEFLSGYQSRYGLYYVDFEDKDRKRQPKLSALWYRDFLMEKKQHMAT